MITSKKRAAYFHVPRNPVDFLLYRLRHGQKRDLNSAMSSCFLSHIHRICREKTHWPLLRGAATENGLSFQTDIFEEADEYNASAVLHMSSSTSHPSDSLRSPMRDLDIWDACVGHPSHYV